MKYCGHQVTPYFFSQRPRGRVLWGVGFENILKARLSILARAHKKAKFLIVIAILFDLKS
jgi:hypothetical protein